TGVQTCALPIFRLRLRLQLRLRLSLGPRLRLGLRPRVVRDVRLGVSVVVTGEVDDHDRLRLRLDPARVGALCGRLVMAAQRLEPVGADQEEPLPQLRLADAREQLLDDEEGRLVLAEVGARAALDEGDLHRVRHAQLTRLRLGDDGQSLLRATEAALAVGLDRRVRVDAAEPAHGPHLAERLRVPPGRVRGEGHRLADDVDPARTPNGGRGVLVGSLGVDVDHATGHDEVLGDPVGVRLRQRAQTSARRPVEHLGDDVLVDRGRRVARLLTSRCTRFRGEAGARAPSGAAVEARALPTLAAVTAAVRPATVVGSVEAARRATATVLTAVELAVLTRTTLTRAAVATLGAAATVLTAVEPAVLTRTTLTRAAVATLATAATVRTAVEPAVLTRTTLTRAAVATLA